MFHIVSLKHTVGFASRLSKVFSFSSSFSGEEHVPTYHEWMKDPVLLEATDSEPLSFEEEIEMQQSWRDDPKKCTFIVHSTDACKAMESGQPFLVQENLAGMVGDVNLFLSDVEEEEPEDENDKSEEPDNPKLDLQAEIDIMIAEKGYQKQGLGRAATCTMLAFGIEKLGVDRYFCKINEDNIASINLFKSLGFEQCDYAACFKQVELEIKTPFTKLKQQMAVTLECQFERKVQ